MAERKQFTCNSFVFYGSFYEAISVLPAENQAHIYDAIFKFAFENIEVDLDGVELAVFLLIKPQLIANRTRYENGCKGGAPRGNQNARKKTTDDCLEETTENNRKTTEVEFENNRNQPNDNDNENDISLLSKLKNKLSSAGAYTGVHDGLIDEVVEALATGCGLSGTVTFGGKHYTATTFQRIADKLDVEQVAFVVNRLLNRRDEIDNRTQYILSVFATKYGLAEDER